MTCWMNVARAAIDYLPSRWPMARLHGAGPAQGRHRRGGFVVAQVPQAELVVARRAVGVDRQGAVRAQSQRDGLAQLERAFDRKLLAVVARLRVGRVER